MATATKGAMAQSENYFLHTVTKGQGLYSISRMYGVTEAEIIQSCMICHTTNKRICGYEFNFFK